MRDNGVGFGFLLIAFAGLLIAVAALLFQDEDDPTPIDQEPISQDVISGNEGVAVRTSSGGRISANEALSFIGADEIVCGIMASGTFSDESNGQPTFLNLGRAYPDHVFTAVIWGRNRTKFSQPPEELYADKCICVSGEVSEFGGRPQIEIKSPDQVELLPDDASLDYAAYCSKP